MRGQFYAPSSFSPRPRNVVHVSACPALAVPSVAKQHSLVHGEYVNIVVVVVVLLGNPTGLSWPNNRDSEIFLQLLPESVQRRS